jgi:hypothetical protein
LIGGDWNADGHRDLAVTIPNADSLAILLGDGKGSLSLPYPPIAGNRSGVGAGS